MENIFKELPKYSNNELKTIKKRDYPSFVRLIEGFKPYERKAGLLAKSQTFGVEIEFENIDYQDYMVLKYSRLHTRQFRSWDIIDDLSLPDIRGRSFGLEAVSPILKDKRFYWEELKEMCEFLKHYGSIGASSGAHIHFGAKYLKGKKENWERFFLLWSAYEDVLYRFSYGDYENARTDIALYAEPISEKFYFYYDLLGHIANEKFIIENYGHTMTDAYNPKFVAVNISNAKTNGKNKNTIEFRTPNGTLNFNTWQNNINTFSHLLEYARDKNYDLDLVKARYEYNKENKINNIKTYNSINLESALELSDLLFSKNEDKIFFLKQYLKDNSYEPFPKGEDYTNHGEKSKIKCLKKEHKVSLEKKDLFC